MSRVLDRRTADVVELKARPKRRRWIIASVLVLALAGGGTMLARSQLYGLTSIAVAGTTFERAVIDASELQPGQNVLALDLEEAAQRVRALPFVADAVVRRDGRLGVVIDVTERVAVVQVRAGGSTVHLDQTGARIEAPPAGSRLPVVRIPNSMRALDPDAVAFVQRALAFWEALPAKMRRTVSALRASLDGSIVFTMGATKVIFGDARRVGAKLRAIEAVMQRAAASGRSVRRIDVRSPSRAAAVLT